MKVLVIGGTGLIGPDVVDRLVQTGADVFVVNRKGTCLNPGATAIACDRRDVASLRKVFSRVRPDVGIDMIPFTLADAEGVVAAASGHCNRLNLVSSIDVYLAYGRLHRTEPGPVLEGVITEDSPLRTKLGADGARYDKRSVEQVFREARSDSGSILRLPMVYGPRDHLRVMPYVKRMLDGRRHIVLGHSFANWRVSRVAAQSCALAIALCANSTREGLQIFNVAEEQTYSEREWVERIGCCVEWQGKVVEVGDALCPPPHGIDGRQHMVISSRRIRAQLGFQEEESPASSLAEAVRWAIDALEKGRHHEAPDYEAEDQILLKAGL